MPDHTYVFIDGAYLRRRHREAMQQLFGVNGEIELSPIMQKAGASRVYFYDAIDYTQRDKEPEKDWEARVLALEQFFANLQLLEGFHVRPGSVTRGKKREQKEVDVLLAVDMLTHGFNGSMGKAVLIAGDVDFRPVVKALVEHGVFVHVWYHRDSFAQELPGAADLGREISFRELYEWNTDAFKVVHRIPLEYREAGARGGRLLKAGSAGRWRAELYERPGSTEGSSYWVWLDSDRSHSIVVRDPELDLIERYIAAQYGPIRWSASKLGVSA